jgi:hypothetical protein
MGSVRCCHKNSSSAPTVDSRTSRTLAASHDPGRPARICVVPPMLAAAPASASVTNAAQSIGRGVPFGSGSQSPERPWRIG